MVDERIATAAMQLIAFPESGRSGRVEGTRELVVSRTPYILPYWIAGDTVCILRVIHGAQLGPEQFDE